MATVILGGAGGAIGGPAGQALGAALGSYIDQNFIFPALFPQDNIQGPRLGDLKIQSGDEGAPIMRCFGAENRVPGTVFWTSGLKETATTQNTGKGGPGIDQVTYTYAVDLAVAFCEGPPDGSGIQSVQQIYANTKTLYKSNANKSVSSTLLSATAGEVIYCYPVGDGQECTVKYYTLQIDSPNGGPDLAQLTPGINVTVDGFTETTNNGEWKLIDQGRDSVAGTSYLVLKRYGGTLGPFADDANGSANLIELSQTIPQFNPQKVQDITFYTGTETQTAPPLIAAAEENVPGFRGQAYATLTNLQLGDYGNTIPNFNALVHATGTTDYLGVSPETVGGVLQKLLAYAKLDESALQGLSDLTFDTTAVDDITVRAFQLSGVIPLRSAIQPLQVAFDITAQEENGVVTFFRRKDAPVVALDPDDMAAHQEGGDSPRYFETFDRQGQSLPKEVEVTYLEPDKRYQTGSQRAKRVDSSAPNVRSVDLPIVLSGSEAKEVAERVLWTQWANRRGIRIVLPSSYWTIQENDVVTWTDPDTAKPWRVLVQKVDRGYNGLVEIEGVEEVAALLDFTSEVDGPDPSTVTDEPYSPPELELVIMDAAPFTEAETTLTGFYYAMRANFNGALWPGGALFRATDGVTFTQVEDVPEEALIGLCGTALEAVPCSWLWDRASTLRVVLGPGKELSSITEDEVVAGANIAYVGGEVIAFATATLIEDGTYDLTNFLRGLSGTEEAIGTHQANEEIVFLNEGGVGFHLISPTRIGIETDYKPVPYGGDEADFEEQPHPNVSACRRPLSVVHLTAENLASGDWELEWQRRTRSFIDPLTRDDIPLLENEERYEIEVRNVATGDAVNVYESLVPSLTYTSAQQTQDFGSAQATIRVAIYQMSPVMGRGKVNEQTFS